MKSFWLERVIDSVADRGRELLRLRGNHRAADTTESLCRALLAERGEASGTALARELVLHYRAMSEAERAGFFCMLNTTFGPDQEAIAQAVGKFMSTSDPDSYLALRKVTEPARQKLIRLMAIAPKGIEAIVALRADLLRAVRDDAGLRAVDADLRYLLKSWFNRGFLELQRIDWTTPASILEKLINYESVHEIQSWSELRRRLEDDRRCFAFFHPALPQEPLIFIEAALVKGMSHSIAPLLDEGSAVLEAAEADSVIFYSINNCLEGLRGISFGNFLIKQVATELAREFPGIRSYSTLSPMPGFLEALRDPEVFSAERIGAILGDDAATVCNAAGAKDVPESLERLLADPVGNRNAVSGSLQRLGLAYLAFARRNGRPVDPVACFHLSNGARLERINLFANSSSQGLAQSAGMMVNYRYIPEDFEANHEAFVLRGEIAMSRPLQKEARVIRECW